MSARVDINFMLGKRRIEFVMLTDAGNIADHNTISAIERDGCCEPEVARVMGRVVREGDSVIDVGANVGYFTLLLARLVGERGSVIAFEPAQGSFSKLRENIKLWRQDPQA